MTSLRRAIYEGMSQSIARQSFTKARSIAQRKLRPPLPPVALEPLLINIGCVPVTIWSHWSTRELKTRPAMRPHSLREEERNGSTNNSRQARVKHRICRYREGVGSFQKDFLNACPQELPYDWSHYAVQEMQCKGLFGDGLRTQWPHLVQSG
ncbi:hypothetical protein L218DRAFT_946689 [Marasmius fiardii PR-910]|nr:hypothetical protein L218DRAFT_946689 [Marasmius fiardii PR-910]